MAAGSEKPGMILCAKTAVFVMIAGMNLKIPAVCLKQEQKLNKSIRKRI
jgi:hypothetical protein